MDKIFLVCNLEGRWVKEVIIGKSLKETIAEKETNYNGLTVIELSSKDIKNIIEKLLEFKGEF